MDWDHLPLSCLPGTSPILEGGRPIRRDNPQRDRIAAPSDCWHLHHLSDRLELNVEDREKVKEAASDLIHLEMIV